MKSDAIRSKGLTLKRGWQSVIQIPEIGTIFRCISKVIFQLADREKVKGI